MDDEFYLECCPFCGPQDDGLWTVVLAETKDVRDDYVLGYVVHCPKCEYEMVDEFMDDLLDTWNARFYHIPHALTDQTE